MRAIKLNALVTSDHTLHLDLPEDVEEGPAEVIVLVEGSQEAATGTSAGSVAEFMSEPRIDRRFLRSKEAIDEGLRTERASWE